MEHLIDPNWSITHFEVLQILSVISDKLRGSEVEKIQALNRVYESAVEKGWVYHHKQYMGFVDVDPGGLIVVPVEGGKFINRVQGEIDRAIPQQAKLIDFKEIGKYE